MAKLKAVVASLDDVPEAFRDLYAKSGDSFRLDAEGVEDVTGLKSALERERTEAKAARKKVEAYGDLSPDDVVALKADKAERERRDAEAKGEWKKLETQLTENHGKVLKAYEGQVAELTTALEDEMIVARATEAITKAEGSVKLLLPHVRASVRVVKGEDGRRKAVVVGEDGKTPLLKKDAKQADQVMEIGDFVLALRESDDFSGAFKPVGGSGSGAAGSGAWGGGASRVVDRNNPMDFGLNLEAIDKGTARLR